LALYAFFQCSLSFFYTLARHTLTSSAQTIGAGARILPLS
jgi:hypothetical protein